MDLRPGGAFVTEMSENGGEFMPHVAGCYLAVDHQERIVFTDALLGGWPPAEQSFMDKNGHSAKVVRMTEEVQRPEVLIGAALTYYVLTIPLAFSINALDRRQRILR